MFKTRTPNHKEVTEKWVQVNAEGQRIGRLATKVAELLLDKSNPHMRDYLTPKVKVVVVNAAKLDISEKKQISKLYTRYSGYRSGQTVTTLGEMHKAFPERVIELAVRRMLPKNRRGRAIFTNLYVYADNSHKHEAQQPQQIDINEFKV